MLESLHAPVSEVDAARAEEIECRVVAFDRGGTPSYSTEDLSAEARRLSR